MAKKSKSTASTPQPKSTTTSTPKPKSTVPTPKTAPAAVDFSRHDAPVEDVESGPEEEATPAVRASKRKAPLDRVAPTPSSSKKPRVAIHTTEATPISAAGKKSSLRHMDASVEIPIPSPTATKPTTATGKHIRFDDDDGPNEFYTPQEGPARNPLDAQQAGDEPGVEGEEEGEGEDSDDDAPEAVSTSTSAAQAAKAAEAAARAAEKQQEDLRRKRQERDAKFKKQAEARKKTQQLPTTTADPAPEEKDTRLPDIGTASSSSRKRIGKRSLPSILPDEFLASDSESDAGSGDDDGAETASGTRKIKFNTAARQVARAEARHPADHRVGGTVYRVMKKQGPREMAPKGGRYSRNAREMLLGRGRPGALVGGARKGFLVKR